MGLLDDIFAIRNELNDVADEVKQTVLEATDEARSAVSDVADDLKNTTKQTTELVSKAQAEVRRSTSGALDGIVRPNRHK